MAFTSLQEIVHLCDKQHIDFAEAVLLNESAETKEATEKLTEDMTKMWDAMLFAAANYNGELKSASGLAGGDGARMDAFAKKNSGICGCFMDSVIAEALKMGESNACMKRIVAAPTAGSCGVMPAVMIPLYLKHRKQDEDVTQKIVSSLFTAAGIGQVIAYRASISGAQGGCQAEIGSASAMAAGALVYFFGGTPMQSVYAAGMAMQNLLGLVCDPVAGLVEVPCVKRNVVGAVNACSACDMALSGIKTVIPPDQIIDAMKEIGDKMHKSLRETGEGGIAGTDKGLKIALSLLKK